LLGHAGDEETPGAPGLHAFELGEGRIHPVVTGKQAEADDALWVGPLELLEHPVVVGMHTRHGERAVRPSQ
jgi:hypothetical protein